MMIKHRDDMEDINIFYRSLINAKQANEGSNDQLAFDLNYFRRKPKVVDILTKQAKQFMKTLPNYRSDEEIDVIVRLVLCVMQDMGEWPRKHEAKPA